MDIWNLPHVPDGDKRYIRKEYTEVSQLNQGAQLIENFEQNEEVGNDPDRENKAEE